MTMLTIELFGSSECPYTAALRERLDLDGLPFVEYDVERDVEARARLLRLTMGRAVVPVLVEAGRVTAIGWQGRSCAVVVARERV